MSEEEAVGKHEQKGHGASKADHMSVEVIEMQSTPSFCRVVDVVREEEAVEKRALEWEVEWWVAGQAKGAIEESRQRQARALRVEKLKVGGEGQG